jgi:hypothetical protein
MEDLASQEWDRLEDEAERARREFMDHKLSGFAVWREGDTPLGTASVAAVGNREWWARFDELKEAAKTTRAAADHFWERHRPR